MTTRWATECKEANAQRPVTDAQRQLRTIQPSTINRQMLFGIVQGGTFEDLRRQSAQAIVDIGFDGYAIGGVSVGEPEEEMMPAVEASEPFLPTDKPRYGWDSARRRNCWN